MVSFASPALLVTEFKFHQKIIGLQQRLKVNHVLEFFAQELQVEYLLMRSSGLRLVMRGRLQSQSQ